MKWLEGHHVKPCLAPLCLHKFYFTQSPGKHLFKALDSDSLALPQSLSPNTLHLSASLFLHCPPSVISRHSEQLLLSLQVPAARRIQPSDTTDHKSWVCLQQTQRSTAPPSPHDHPLVPREQLLPTGLRFAACGRRAANALKSTIQGWKRNPIIMMCYENCGGSYIINSAGFGIRSSAESSTVMC